MSIIAGIKREYSDICPDNGVSILIDNCSFYTCLIMRLSIIRKEFSYKNSEQKEDCKFVKPIDAESPSSTCLSYYNHLTLINKIVVIFGYSFIRIETIMEPNTRSFFNDPSCLKIASSLT